MSVSELRKNRMIEHLVENLEAGKDVEHYGRLVFAMVARHFLGEDEIVSYLAKSPGSSPEAVRAFVRNVADQAHNPPSPTTIHEWQRLQAFPICPDPDDPSACNVYADLALPASVYESVERFHEERRRSTTTRDGSLHVAAVREAFEKLFTPRRGAKRFRSSGLRFVELDERTKLVEQNPKKPSEWGELARAGHRVAWALRDGRYLARVIDGQVELLD